MNREIILNVPNQKARARIRLEVRLVCSSKIVFHRNDSSNAQAKPKTALILMLFFRYFLSETDLNMQNELGNNR